MSDQSVPSTPALEDRLSAVVVQIRQALISLPRFRPADSELAAAFDAVTSSLIQTAIDISAAAAVDHAAIMVALELAAQRKAHNLAMQELQATQDNMPRPTIPFLRVAP